MSQFKVGIAQVEYKPPIGLPLMGNFRDDYASRGFHDPLYASAMVIADSKTKFVLFSIDICYMTREQIAFIRKIIFKKTGIPQENVMVTCTHSHSAPSTVEIGSLPKSLDSEIAKMLTTAVDSVLIANKSLKPSTIASAYAQENRLSFNRRLKCKDGKTHMNWEGLDPNFVIKALGPIDTTVSSIFVLQNAKPAGVLVNFALHPAILAGDNWLYSADYPGYLREAMRMLLSNDCTMMFLNGCCGNMNHIDYSDPLQGRGYMMAQRVGYMLAANVTRSMRGVEVC